MHIFVDNEIQAYDGRQLSSLWALRTFNIQGDSIVTFRGPCRVDLSDLVDIRDWLDHAPIFSPDMQHFIVEHFELDLEKTIYRQRLLITIIKDQLIGFFPEPLRREGDDLYHTDRKLSVSIATLTPVSTMIHVGLNITTDGVPVPAVGLKDLGLNDVQVAELARNVCRAYAVETKSIALARCKVRGVP